MEKVEKKIDMNTLIEDFSFQLSVGKGQNEIYLSFRNVTNVVIKEIAFLARGYDYFDEPIESNGKNAFLIEVKHLNLHPGEELKDYRVAISKAIRKVELKQEYVIDQNGTKKIYTNADNQIYYFEKFFKESYKDKIIFETLRKQNAYACCYPKQNKDTWLCACGYLNRKEEVKCKYCQSLKESVFSTCSKEAINRTIKEDELEFYKKMKKRQVEREQRENKELILFLIKFVFVILLILALIYTLLHCIA